MPGQPPTSRTVTDDIHIVTYRLAPRRDVPWPRLKLVLVADIHACTPYTPLDRVRAMCRHANALGGDMIFLMGDYVGHVWGGQPLPPEEVVPILSTLTAPQGVYAIIGNHEWDDDRAAQTRATADTTWHRALAASPLTLLCNEARHLDTPQGSLTLAGLDSQRAFSDRFRGRFSGADDFDALRPALDPARPTILLAHEPDIFPDLPDHIDLTLAGHMHRGQIAPFGRPLQCPSRYGTRYAYGHFEAGTRQMVVSGGLGYSLLPIRIGAPPELTVVDLG